ncbi:MAG: 2-oxo acid dehydrogenase subunit E2 [Lachnospiraceae bacterium]|nr:2-oxo acid dehydrogenase subunit E2 [Lachnospiraceae bacterium]
MRKDGRRLKTMQPMYQVAAHIMADRNDATNMIRVDIPADPIQQFLNKKRKEGKHYSHLAVYIATIVRTIAKYPYLNRFVVNKKIYARNEIAVGMVVLKPGEPQGTMNKMYFEPTNTLDDVERILEEYVEQNRGAGDTNSTDDLINKLLKIPGLCRFGVNVFKWMDKHGLLPKGVIKASPFHCSLTITNLASIGTNYIYHHVYNFGTTSMLVAVGNAVEIPRKTKDGFRFEKCWPWGIVMDERIADGCEYAIAFRYMQKLLKDPSLLEVPPDEVVEDIP